MVYVYSFSLVFVLLPLKYSFPLYLNKCICSLFYCPYSMYNQFKPKKHSIVLFLFILA